MSLYPWQQQSWAGLCEYRTQNRVPQALLYFGNKGLGKLHLARQFAYSLLCPTPMPNGLSCGRCASCLLVSAQTHPDFMEIAPEEPSKTITVGQIRALIGTLSLKPQFETYRVVIVNPADHLNNAAANAFLKYLEEPTERTVLLLVTDKPARLPATIVSRCQKVAIISPGYAQAEAWLQAQQPLGDRAALLLALAQGSPLLALEYANTDMLAMRDNCFKAWMAVASKQKHPVNVAEEWHKLPEAPLMFCLLSWLTDFIKCHYKLSADSMYNPDLHPAIQTLARQLELKGLYRLYDLLLASKQKLATQVNKQIMYEDILIHWQALNTGK